MGTEMREDDDAKSLLVANTHVPAPGSELAPYLVRALGGAMLLLICFSFLKLYLPQSVAFVICLLGAGAAAWFDHHHWDRKHENCYQAELRSRRARALQDGQ